MNKIVKTLFVSLFLLASYYADSSFYTNAQLTHAIEESFWIEVNHMLPAHLIVHDIAVFGENHENLMIASDNGTYASYDLAMSWKDVSKGLQHPEVQCLAVTNNGSNLYAGTRRNGVVRFLPLTENWVRYSTNLPARSIHSLSTSQEYLYAGTHYEGLYRVKIGSERWTDLTVDDKNSELKDCSIFDIAIVSEERIFLATDKGIIFTEDGGLVWRYHSDNALRFKQFTSIAYDINHQQIIAGTDGRGLVISKDLGKTWQELQFSTQSIAQALVQRVCFHPEEQDIWYMATDREGVFLTQDAGKSWNEINEGLSNTRIKSMIGLSGNFPILLAGTVGSGIFMYHNILPPEAPEWSYLIGNKEVKFSWKPALEGTYPIGGYTVYRASPTQPNFWETRAKLPPSHQEWIDTQVEWQERWLYAIRAFDSQDSPFYSSFGDIQSILVDDIPVLLLSYPPDNFETEEEQIQIRGEVRDEGSGVKSLNLSILTAQGVSMEQALEWKDDGSFEASISLELGWQTLQLEAQDLAGNTARLQRKIHRKEPVRELIIRLQIGRNIAYIGERSIQLPVAPLIFRSRTMVPLRFLAEAFGAKVDWIGSRREIQITYREVFITLWLNETRVVVENLMDPSLPPIQKQLDVYPFLNQNTTMVPIRFISEEFSAKIEWKAETQEIIIIWSP